VSRIEKLSHFCVIALCLASAALLIEKRFAPRPPKRAAASETAFLGKRIGIPLPLEERTRVVVFMTTECPFCLKSLPLYRKFSDIESKGGSPPTRACGGLPGAGERNEGLPLGLLYTTRRGG